MKNKENKKNKKMTKGDGMRNIKVLFALTAALLASTPTFAKSYGSKICQDSQYTCYTVKRGDSWKNLFPNEAERDVVMRINRTNNTLHSGRVIAIPKNNSGEMLAFAPFSRDIDPPGQKVIMVSLKKLAFGAYSADGRLVYWGPISAARGYCPDTGRRCTTKTGVFHVYTKGGAGCKSTRYPVGRGGAPMPYCMFFNGNYALHGSYDVPGYHASHGCVRLFVKDAKWLNQEFTPGGQTKVKVY